MTSPTVPKDAILTQLVEILRDMTQDWDVDPGAEIGAETRLIRDLAFESIDVVQLVVAIEERFGRRDLPFEQLLMEDGRYADEISVRDTVDFLHDHLNRSA